MSRPNMCHWSRKAVVVVQLWLALWFVFGSVVVDPLGGDQGLPVVAGVLSHPFPLLFADI